MHVILLQESAKQKENTWSESRPPVEIVNLVSAVCFIGGADIGLQYLEKNAKATPLHFQKVVNFFLRRLDTKIHLWVVS